MSDQINKELLKNGEIYDFDTAMNDYGFPFDDYLETNFESLIKTTFIKEFMILRKAISDHNYEEIRFYSHKFKSPFRMMCSEKIASLCEQIQKSIDEKNFNIDNLCTELISKMLEFFQELITFLIKVDHPPEKNLIDQFWKLNKESDSYKGCQKSINESSGMGGVATDNRKNNEMVKQINEQNNNIIVESKDYPMNKKAAGYCCTTKACVIF